MSRPTLADFQNRPGLTHLKRLTTKEGAVQHADHDVPDPSFGYSIDDNARALIACLWHYKLFQDQSVLQLAEIYFDYLKKAEKEGGTFHNFFSFTEKILDAEGSEDSIGRAIWALGEVIANHPDEQTRTDAEVMLKRANLNRHVDHAHLRTKAYILLGLAAAGKIEEMKPWADMLVDRFNSQATDDWQWFEDSLRYCNGTLPYALSIAYLKTKDWQYLETAKKCFDWLDSVSRIDGLPAPIGQSAWYYHNQDKSLYDQQPVDAADMALAASGLYRASGNKEYLDKSMDWMSWYAGNNSKEVVMIDEKTKGVYDAVTPGGFNANQGAESIVTYLLAYIALSEIAHDRS